MTKCKVCGKDIAASAKACPNCGAKNKKPFYKKWWVWAIVVIVLIAALGNTDNSTTTNTVQNETQTVVNTENKTTEAPKVSATKEPDVPTEYKSALKKAKLYSDNMYMSKAGIYDQLVSEYGEKFSKEAAQYAIDNVEADWKRNALKKAESYQETMSMSPAAIRDQLISEYGEKFTQEEADYAIANLK